MKKLWNKVNTNKGLIVSVGIIIILLTTIAVLLCTTTGIEDYNILQAKLTKKEKQYNQLENEKNKIETQNKDLEKQINELSQEEKQEELNDTIKELEDKVSVLETKKQSLDAQIKELENDVIKLKGEPKTYPAGHLTAGTDVPTGKYKIYEGSRNFVVYSASGSLEVNIILGGRYGVEEYIYTFKKGDKIEADSSFKLVEVE